MGVLSDLNRKRKKVQKKITRGAAKVLDKVIPNEIKPALPYLANILPFLLPPGMGTGAQQGIMALLRRGVLTGALPNAVAQLSQEGNEGELNPLSLLLSTASGAMSGAARNADGIMQSSGNTFRNAMNPGVAATGTPVAGGQFSTALQGGFDTSGLTAIDKGKNFLLKGGAKIADAATSAGKVLRDPFAKDVGLLDIAKAGATPFSQATGDLAYAQGVKQLKDFNAAEAAAQVAAAASQAGFDQSYIDAITSSMGDYGYNQVDIDEIINMYGFANGGRVGLMNGGEPDFISMREVVENVGNDEMMEGIRSSEQAFNMGGSVLPQGMEMDYRGGGMIPMGSKERADDVPARVSKNEFVITADAVRAAGGGSVNKGAQKMYQLMNNLEAKV